MEFEHVDVADGRLLLHHLARAAVIELSLAVPRQARLDQHVVDLIFTGTIKHRRDGLEAKLHAGPPKMGFQDLPHVHAAGHAERIEKDLHRRSVRQEGHVLLGENLCDHTLVTVSAGHLVAD